MKPQTPIGYDYCKDCKETKELEFFPKGSGTYCRKCLGDRQKKSPNYKENARKNSLKKFGITIEQYDKINERQNGLCAICSKPEMTKSKARLAVDHDHKTAFIRGLLCNTCNSGLGKFYDSKELLENAIWYLQKSQLDLETELKKIMTDNLEGN